MKKINKDVPYYKEITYQCLIHYYSINLKQDIGSYRIYILYFLANKIRKSTIYPCINSYHRKLVHNFCDSQGLKHETIEQGTKKFRVCRNCHSQKINIEKDYYGEYYCYCNECKNHKAGYSVLNDFISYKSFSQKVIKITKI